MATEPNEVEPRIPRASGQNHYVLFGIIVVGMLVTWFGSMQCDKAQEDSLRLSGVGPHDTVVPPRPKGKGHQGGSGAGL
jgi:hypothetical protein